MTTKSIATLSKIRFGCKVHPKYKAKRKPENCQTCLTLFLFLQGLQTGSIKRVDVWES